MVCGWVEVHPALVEAFADRVSVDPVGGGWWRPGGRGFGPTHLDRSTVPVREAHPVGLVGVAGDPEFAFVVQSVVVWAEGDQIDSVSLM